MSALPTPGLYLVATPIGNLGDMTYRAVDILRQVDTILCEDTRTSRALLQHYGIATPLSAYHDHNEAESTPALIARLQGGATLALISDAGMPLVADPGYRLVSACHDSNIAVRVLPGASAPIAAIAGCGLPPLPFTFIGFVPSKEAAILRFWEEYRYTPGLLVAFETARRLETSLRLLQTVLGGRRAAVARELTKHFEEIRRDSLENLIAWYTEHPPKGEVVLLVEGHTAPPEGTDNWQDMLVTALQHKPLNEAVREVAALSGTPKNTVYAAALALQAGG